MSEEKKATDDTTMPFGKWQDTPLSEVPDDYWEWFLTMDWAKEKVDLYGYAKGRCDCD